MRPFRALVLGALALLATPAFAQENQPWPPIPPEDLALKDSPTRAGASALILLKTDTRDDKKGERELYYRIKIFNEKGVSQANIEIPYVHKLAEIKDIAARVIRPDGQVVPFYGPFLEKTLARARKQRVLAKTIALPDVQPGCIIEYRYRMKLKSGQGNIWTVQEPLDVREARMELRSNPGLKILPRSLPDGSEMLESKGGIFRATLRNLPAFEEEVLMPPEDSIRMRYRIAYGSFSYWGAASLSEWINNFIDKPKKLEPVAQQLVAASDAPEVKVRKIYAAVQARIRNLSFEESYSKKERKRESMSERKKAEDVWQLRYGTAPEIVQLFAGLCRAAGLTADVVYVVPRENNLYDPDMRLMEQLEWPLAVVDLAGGPQYFDPGTRFAPFGWVGWQYQGTQGARLGNSWAEVKIPLLDSKYSGPQRKVTLEIQPDGGARVRMVANYTGQAALDRRNEFFDLSPEQIDRKLREELEGLVPQARLPKAASRGLDGAGDAVEISYEMEVPDMAQKLGDRLVIRPVLSDWSSPFGYWKRTHPVYLPQSYSAVREVRVVPPPGYALAHEPRVRKVDFPFASMETNVTREGTTAVLTLHLTVKASYLRTKEQYSEVKRFFDFVAAGDQLHLVFEKTAAAAGGVR